MIWPHVRSALEKEVLAPGARVRHVTVSGHSLGAAVATLVSFAAQRFLDAHSANVTVGTILVASPNGAQAGALVVVVVHIACTFPRFCECFYASVLSPGCQTRAGPPQPHRPRVPRPPPLAVGNLAFVQSHAALVNSRRITYANDVITMVPCTGGGEGGRGMPACNAKASQGGKVAVWTE